MPDTPRAHITHCIFCGQSLHICEQHWTHTPRVDLLLDCRNPDCRLYMVTASEVSYRETVEAFLVEPTDWQGKEAKTVQMSTSSS